MPILYGFTDDEIKVFPGVVLEVTPRSALELTKKPVETGFVVTDHAVTQNKRITVKLHTSPLVVSGQAITPAEARVLLDRIQSTKSVCTITTDAGDWEEMLLTEWSVTRSAEQGISAVFELEFEELRVIATRTVRPRARRNRPLVTRGAQSVSDTPEPRNSLAASLFEDYTGMTLLHRNNRR